ncbi:MAG: hypothetical protein ABIF82_01515 [Planctomycetota bacterium]
MTPLRVTSRPASGEAALSVFTGLRPGEKLFEELHIPAARTLRGGMAVWGC